MAKRSFNPQWIVIHHNGVAGRTIEDIRRTHTAPKPKGFGWADIGYHYVIEDDAWGTIRRGRPETQMGAHAAGANGWAEGSQDDTLAICVVGNFNKAKLSSAQALSLFAKLNELMVAYNIPPSRVIGHREIALVPGAKPTRKTCPGKLIDMGLIRSGLPDYTAGKAAV